MDAANRTVLSKAVGMNIGTDGIDIVAFCPRVKVVKIRTASPRTLWIAMAIVPDDGDV